jgi:hypothetical protein
MSGCKLQPRMASPGLEAFIISQAGPWYVCDSGTCIPNLESLIRWKETYGENRYMVPIPVYPRAKDSPFTEVADGAYQAWHDRLHAEGEYEFNISGEIRLAGLHMALCKRAGLTDEDCMFLYHFIVTRVMYHYWHDGKDPDNRAEFMDACFRFGCKAAARGDHEMQYSDLCG